MSTQCSVLIVEDDETFRLSFCEAVSARADLRLVAAVGTLAEAREIVGQAVPDVLIVDLGLPDGSGITLVREATARRPDCDPLVVTVFGDDAHIVDAIEAGATGYLLKDSPAGELLRWIDELRAGGSPISPSVARRLLERVRRGETAATALRGPSMGAATVAGGPARSDGASGSGSTAADLDAPGAGPLTTREIEVLRMVAKGLSFADVGRALTMSPNTVVTHVKKIYRKLAVHSRGEAVFEAQAMGLLRPR